MGRGGGNDGGVTANSRAFMVKEKTEDRGARDRERKFASDRLLHCALSGDALLLRDGTASGPVVCDRLGNLLLKEGLLGYMLEKRDLPAFAHIRSLKRDVFAVNLSARRTAGDAAGAAAARGPVDSSSSTSDAGMFYCPLTSEDASGAHAFVALRSCGCVISERALRELGAARPSPSSSSSSSAAAGAGAVAEVAARPAAELCCPACNVAVPSDADVVRLAPSEEEADVMRTVLQREREKEAEGKSKEKKSKGKAAAASGDADALSDHPDAAVPVRVGAKRSLPASEAGESSGAGAAPAVKRGRPEAADGAAAPAVGASAPAAGGAGTSASASAASSSAAPAPRHAHGHGHHGHHSHGHGHGHAQVMRDDSGLASRASQEATRAIEQRKAGSAVYSQLFKSAPATGSAAPSGPGGAAASSRAGGSVHMGRW